MRQVFYGAILPFLLIQSAFAEPYGGLLTCENLSKALGRMHGDVHEQCRLAHISCRSIDHFNQLSQKHPLQPILSERLEDFHNFALEICELAIHIEHPEYYESELERPAS